jgi:hypothetical protein
MKTINSDDDFDPEPAPPPMMMEASQPAPAASTGVISLDNMRTAMIANFEQADLDVPAFLRKSREN